MLKRLTIRLNSKSVKSLKLYKLIFNKNHKKISYSKIINLLIYFKLPKIEINQNYIKYFEEFKKKSDAIHSDKYYIKYTYILADLTNSINHLSRKFKSVSTNINQLAHVANINNKLTPNLAHKLNTYHSYMIATIYFCYLLNKKVSNQWKI